MNFLKTDMSYRPESGRYRIIHSTFLAIFLLCLSLNAEVVLKETTLVLKTENASYKYQAPEGYVFEKHHVLENRDICVIGSYSPAKYKKLQILRPGRNKTLDTLYSSQEFFLPEFDFYPDRIEIFHQIPIEKFSHSDSPIRINSIINMKDGVYQSRTGKINPDENPVFLYYFAKKHYERLNIRKSLAYFERYLKKADSKSVLFEETLYFLCRLSSFLDKRKFDKYYGILHKYFPSSPYKEVFDIKEIDPGIEKNLFLGTQFFLNGKFNQSLKYTLVASKLAQKKKRSDYLPKIYYKLALLYEKHNKITQARNMYREVLMLDKNSMYGRFSREKLDRIRKK